MPLNDAKVKAAKAREKPYKLADSGQLYLQVTTAGSRLWRMNYAFGKNAAGKAAQRTLTIGAYPIVSLAEAREARDAAKRLLLAGRDPGFEKKLVRDKRATAVTNTFEVVFRRWFELKSGWSLEKRAAWIDVHGSARVRDAEAWTKPDARGWSAVHSDDVFRSIERDALPSIGQMPIDEITSVTVLEILEAVQARGSIESAQRLRQRLSDIFITAAALKLRLDDPAPATLLKVMQERPKARPQRSVVDRIRDNDQRIAAVRTLLVACDKERTRATTKFALRLLALTAVRPGEVANARWSEFDLTSSDPTWTIPPERMKGDRDRKEEEHGEHLVPLSRQAVELIEALRPLTGRHELMFPSERHTHNGMSENTLRNLLIRAGYGGRHVPHGFRAAFSTIMNERADRAWRAMGQEGLSPDRAIIDLMLAHVPKDRVEGAYNRAMYMPRRRELAQEYADLIAVDLEQAAALIGQPIRYASTGPGKPD